MLKSTHCHCAKNNKFCITILLLLYALLSVNYISAQVTHRDTTVSWQHFDYTLNADGGMGTYSTSNIESPPKRGFLN